MLFNYLKTKQILYTVASIYICPYVYHNLNLITVNYAIQKTNVSKKSEKYYQEFIKYASYYYEGKYYITPNNFINILLNKSPEISKIQTLNKKDVEQMVSKFHDNSYKFAETDGILSYTEYEFLKFLMKKSLAKVNLLFKLMDKNKNEKLDLDEFIQVKNALIKNTDFLNNENTDIVDSQAVNTSLLTYFFGLNGSNLLSFQNFKSFVENMRTEVWRAQFDEVSKGKDTFTAVDLALVLFKQARLPSLVLKEYTDRIKLQIPFNTEISWDEYKQLCTFITYIDDFSAILNMHSIASYDVSQREFKRAVYLSSGIHLTATLCDVLFAIFDHNGDGFINHSEFVRLIKRSHRYGITPAPSSHNREQVSIVQDMSHWYNSYKSCVSHHLKYS